MGDHEFGRRTPTGYFGPEAQADIRMHPLVLRAFAIITVSGRAVVERLELGVGGARILASEWRSREMISVNAENPEFVIPAGVTPGLHPVRLIVTVDGNEIYSTEVTIDFPGP